jgi:hypothetical protein
VPVVLRDYLDEQGRLDVFAEANPGMAHAWYSNNNWTFEILNLSS